MPRACGRHNATVFDHCQRPQFPTLQPVTFFLRNPRLAPGQEVLTDVRQRRTDPAPHPGCVVSLRHPGALPARLHSCWVSCCYYMDSKKNQVPSFPNHFSAVDHKKKKMHVYIHSQPSRNYPSEGVIPTPVHPWGGLWRFGHI